VAVSFAITTGCAKALAPDGYTLGWNDQSGLHPHLHIIPRFDDEPMAGHGVPAPAGTWQDHETRSAEVGQAVARRRVSWPAR
jgi:diadenosine tetraphosphate (Ap4A) HIT family hydrolase